jgi:hypothetical protein
VVIKFDLSPLPSDVEVIEAVLSLYCTVDEYPGGAVEGTVFKLAGPWNETAVTWYQADSGVNWTALGGDLLPDTVARVPRTVPDAANTWENFTVTTAIRTFAADPDTNHGLILIEGHGDGHMYHSSEHTETALRPKLAITYAAVAVEAAVKYARVPLEVIYASNGLFRVSLPGPGAFDLNVYDVLGRLLWTHASAQAQAGRYRLFWHDWNGQARQQGVAVLRQGRETSGRVFIIR